MAYKMKGCSGFKSEGPVKPKSIVSAKKQSIKSGPNPDSDAHIGAVPTFSDHIEEAKVRRKNKKK